MTSARPGHLALCASWQKPFSSTQAFKGNETDLIPYKHPGTAQKCCAEVVRVGSVEQVS